MFYPPFSWRAHKDHTAAIPRTLPEQLSSRHWIDEGGSIKCLGRSDQLKTNLAKKNLFFHVLHRYKKELTPLQEEVG